MFCTCRVCTELPESWGLGFLPAACRQLGLPLAWYSMSQHVASFVDRLMREVAYLHRPVSLGSTGVGALAGLVTPTEASPDVLSS